jgi:hypothetical protein
MGLVRAGAGVYSNMSTTRRALLIERRREALRRAARSWKDKDHPELTAGATQWVTLTGIYAGMRPSEEKTTRRFMRSLLSFGYD